MDEFIEAMLEIYAQAEKDAEVLHTAPHHTVIRRPDEVGAARKPVVRYVWEDWSMVRKLRWLRVNNTWLLPKSGNRRIPDDTHCPGEVILFLWQNHHTVHWKESGRLEGMQSK